jgi:tRNA G18 (ribose-2'-O)-methylase SpoU
MIKKNYLIVDNVRSSENVGSLLRTAEGLGIMEVFLCGYTPYPLKKNDTRLPFIAQKLAKKINKSALGAENSQPWKHFESTSVAIKALKEKNIPILGLEQSSHATAINKFKPLDKLAIVVGNEVNGIDLDILKLCNYIVEIPMLGNKESFNVSTAAAMAMFYFRYML